MRNNTLPLLLLVTVSLAVAPPAAGNHTNPHFATGEVAGYFDDQASCASASYCAVAINGSQADPTFVLWVWCDATLWSSCALFQEGDWVRLKVRLQPIPCGSADDSPLALCAKPVVTLIMNRRLPDWGH